MNFKKSICTGISAMVSASLLVGCSSTAAAVSTAAATASTTSVSFDKIKIGVVLNSTNDVNMKAEEYFNTAISPLLNIDFMFSEVVSDANASASFIENAYAAGCTGIINTAGSDAQVAQSANKLGMYVVNNTSNTVKDAATLPYYLGNTGASVKLKSEAYTDVLKEALKSGEKHNILILTGAASMGATSMIEPAKGILEGLKNKYNLTYSKDIADLAVSNAQTDVDTGTDMKVKIFPGVPKGADYASAISSILQTGEYDVIVTVIDAYSYLSVAINEVEEAKKMDIKYISQAGISDATSTMFNTKDSTGDTICNGIVLSSMSEAWVLAAVQIRNAMDGYADAMRPNGSAGTVLVRPLPVSSADTYNKLSKASNSLMTEEDILSLCDKVDASITSEKISAFADSQTISTVLKKFDK